MQVCKFNITNINVSLGASQQRKSEILWLPNTAIQSQWNLCKIVQSDFRCCHLYKIYDFPPYLRKYSLQPFQRAGWTCHLHTSLCLEFYSLKNLFASLWYMISVAEPKLCSSMNLAWTPFTAWDSWEEHFYCDMPPVVQHSGQQAIRKYKDYRISQVFTSPEFLNYIALSHHQDIPCLTILFWSSKPLV